MKFLFEYERMVEMQTIYHYRCDGCEAVHENSRNIFKCKICSTEICDDCSESDFMCIDCCESELSPSEKIENFIKKNGYTYKVEDILEGYQKYYAPNYYTSHTMTICCKALQKEIEQLIKEKDGGVDGVL
jgi:hypothetical protein